MDQFAEMNTMLSQQPQQQTLSRSSSATSTQLRAMTPAAREYILTISETQMPASLVIQPTQQSQVATKAQRKPRRELTSFVVIDVQLPGPSRTLTFTLTLMKHFNLPQLPLPQAKKVNTTYQDSLGTLGIYSH